MLLTTQKNPPVTRHEPDLIPSDAALVMSALEAAKHPLRNRREARRYAYRVPAKLRLFSDPPGALSSVLYTREVNQRSLGFVSPHRLPLGHGGVLELRSPTGEPMSIHCTLLRCREAAPGWFEGSVYFNRAQLEFEIDYCGN